MRLKFKNSQALLLTFLIAFVVLFDGASCQNTCNYNNSTQPGYNSFLNWLDLNTVLASTYTSNTFEACNDIWSESNVGTCCNKEKLNSTFTKVLNSTANGWRTYITTLVHLRNKVRKWVKEYTSSYDAQKAFQSMQGDSRYDLGGLTAGQAVGILDSLHTFESDMKNFRVDGKACFDILMKKRGQIFCWGCRYGGETYFDSTGPIVKLTPGSAQYLVEFCHTTWKFLVNSMLLEFVWNNLKKFNSVTDEVFDVTKPDIFYNSSATDNLGTVMTAFDNCPNPTSARSTSSNNNCKTADLQILAKAFFNFAKGEKLKNFDPNYKTTTSTSTNSTNSTRLLQAVVEPQIIWDASGIDLSKYPSMATPKLNIEEIEFWTAGGIKGGYKRSWLIGAGIQTFFIACLAIWLL